MKANRLNSILHYRPYQIILAMVSLYLQLEYAMFAGVAVMLLLSPIRCAWDALSSYACPCPFDEDSSFRFAVDCVAHASTPFL